MLAARFKKQAPYRAGAEGELYMHSCGIRSSVSSSVKVLSNALQGVKGLMGLNLSSVADICYPLFLIFLLLETQLLNYNCCFPEPLAAETQEALE